MAVAPPLMRPRRVRAPTLEPPTVRALKPPLLEIAPVLVMERLPPLQSTQPVLELMVVSKLTVVHAMAGAASSVSARTDTVIINLWLKIRREAAQTIAPSEISPARPSAPTYHHPVIFQKPLRFR
jgi:hypothetical protein